MGWATLYISGKPDFEQEVLQRLARSGFSFLPGASDDSDLALYWVNDNALLRDFKKAIGAKTIFKFRLRFYESVAHYHKKLDEVKDTNNFTAHEKAMIGKMKTWEKNAENI
jgi:hypothetical protein